MPPSMSRVKLTVGVSSLVTPIICIPLSKRSRQYSGTVTDGAGPASGTTERSKPAGDVRDVFLATSIEVVSC